MSLADKFSLTLFLSHSRRT